MGKKSKIHAEQKYTHQMNKSSGHQNGGACWRRMYKLILRWGVVILSPIAIKPSRHMYTIPSIHPATSVTMLWIIVPRVIPTSQFAFCRCSLRLDVRLPVWVGSSIYQQGEPGIMESEHTRNFHCSQRRQLWIDWDSNDNDEKVLKWTILPQHHPDAEWT